MSKPLRSPVLGYNHNLRYRGRLFHIQSEDSGPTHPRLYTHLFYEGTILSSKKHEYSADLPEDSVKLAMQQLHKAMIREVTHGEHDERVTAFFAARGQPAFTEPAPARAPAAATAVPATQAEAGAPIAALPEGPQVVQVSGAVTGNNTDGRVVRRPAVGPAPTSASTRPMVVVKPTDLKRPPMVFGQSADGVVVQRNVIIGVGNPGGSGDGEGRRVRAATAYGAPPTQPAPVVQVAPIVRAHGPSPVDKPFSDLVSDKSLDDVILEYLSDDGEPQER